MCNILIHVATMDDDLKRVTNSKACQHRDYEVRRLDGLVAQLNRAEGLIDRGKDGMADHEKALLAELIPLVGKVNNNVMTIKTSLLSCTTHNLIAKYVELNRSGTQLPQQLVQINIPSIRPRVMEESDACPGVGVSNHQVRFRSAEKVRIENLDYFIRIHRATGDCQNPVECTHAAVSKEVMVLIWTGTITRGLMIYLLKIEHDHGRLYFI